MKDLPELGTAEGSSHSDGVSDGHAEQAATAGEPNRDGAPLTCELPSGFSRRIDPPVDEAGGKEDMGSDGTWSTVVAAPTTTPTMSSSDETVLGGNKSGRDVGKECNGPEENEKLEEEQDSDMGAENRRVRGRGKLRAMSVTYAPEPLPIMHGSDETVLYDARLVGKRITPVGEAVRVGDGDKHLHENSGLAEEKEARAAESAAEKDSDMGTAGRRSKTRATSLPSLTGPFPTTRRDDRHRSFPSFERKAISRGAAGPGAASPRPRREGSGEGPRGAIRARRRAGTDDLESLRESSEILPRSETQTLDRLQRDGAAPLPLPVAFEREEARQRAGRRAEGGKMILKVHAFVALRRLQRHSGETGPWSASNAEPPAPNRHLPDESGLEHQ